MTIVQYSFELGVLSKIVGGAGAPPAPPLPPPMILFTDPSLLILYD